MKACGFHCGLCLLIISGCISEEKQVESTTEITFAPFEVPESAPRPEADEPIERYVARWNAWVDSIPEDQRVRHAVERANDQLVEKLQQIPDTPEGFDSWSALDLARPGFLWEEAGEVYESISPELDQMRELVKRNAIAIRLDSDLYDDEGNHFIVYASSVRPAAAALRGRIRYLVLAGRASETVDDVHAIIETHRLMLESPMLVGWLNRSGVQSVACSIIEQTLAIDPDAYTDEQLAQFQDHLISWIDQNMTRIIKVEEYFEILQLRDLYSESVDGELSEEATKMVLEEYARATMFRRILELPLFLETETVNKITTIEFAPLDQQIDFLKEYNEALIADFMAYPPTVQRSHVKQFLDDLQTNRDAVSFVPALMYKQMSETLAGTHILHEVEVRSAIVVLAIHRHRLATGDWPGSLEDISFEHIRVDPVDLHTDEVFNYAIIEGNPLLWSGGPDRDNDGGFSAVPFMETIPSQPDEEYSTNPVRSWFTFDEWETLSDDEQAKYDGDWILFPPADSDRWGNEQGY